MRDYVLFAAFFPQLVAGPIVRPKYFVPQLSDKRSVTPNEVEAMLRSFGGRSPNRLRTYRNLLLTMLAGDRCVDFRGLGWYGTGLDKSCIRSKQEGRRCRCGLPAPVCFSSNTLCVSWNGRVASHG